MRTQFDEGQLMNKYTIEAEIADVRGKGVVTFVVGAYSESSAKERLADMLYSDLDWNLTVTDREIAPAQDDFVLETEEAGK